MGNACRCAVTLYVGEGSKRVLLLRSLLVLSLPLPPTSKVGPSGADIRVGGFAYVQDPVNLSNELSSEAGSFSRCHLNPHGCFQSVVWGFISSHWNSGLCGLSPGPPGAGQLQLCPPCSIICHFVATLPWVLSTWLPLSDPPTSLDECFFFISLVVGLPYSSIFCQFWLLFVFKLLLSSFWLCEET